MNKQELQALATELGIDTRDSDGKELTVVNLKVAIKEAQDKKEEVIPTSKNKVEEIEVSGLEEIESSSIKETTADDSATEAPVEYNFNLEPLKDNRALVALSRFRNQRSGGKRDIEKILAEVFAPMLEK